MGLALAGLATLAAAALMFWRRPVPDEAAAIRARAFEACRAGEWGECMTRLDEARKLDPEGETAPAVVQARRALEAK